MIGSNQVKPQSRSLQADYENVDTGLLLEVNDGLVPVRAGLEPRGGAPRIAASRMSDLLRPPSRFGAAPQGFPGTGARLHIHQLPGSTQLTGGHLAPRATQGPVGGTSPRPTILCCSAAHQPGVAASLSQAQQQPQHVDVAVAATLFQSLRQPGVWLGSSLMQRISKQDHKHYTLLPDFGTRQTVDACHSEKEPYLELLHALLLDLVVEALLRGAEGLAHQLLLSRRQLHHRLPINCAGLGAPQ
ncbi:MAG: hypothetical protein FRX49_09887 [Trebouxia sp. A1-2]|nr:MAG: hypothetical protein FRX49_09887 [Trebouxia sp. A1-2]